MNVKNVLSEEIVEITSYRTGDGKLFLTKEEAVDRVLWLRSPCRYVLGVIYIAIGGAIAALILPMIMFWIANH